MAQTRREGGWGIRSAPRAERETRSMPMVAAVAGAVLLSAIPAAHRALAADGEISGQRLADAVSDELDFDPAVPANNLDVEAQDGVVTLSGEVGSLALKQRAERVAETVRGVMQVDNEIEVDPVTQRPSGEIREDATAALTTSPVAAAWDVDVQVTDRAAIILSGTVPSLREKELAGRLVSDVRGITAVANDLRVEPPHSVPDEKILQQVEQVMRWDALVDGRDVTIAVEDGRVRMSGTVASAAEARRAIRSAWIVGVTDVDAADLQVRPEQRRRASTAAPTAGAAQDATGGGQAEPAPDPAAGQPQAQQSAATQQQGSSSAQDRATQDRAEQDRAAGPRTAEPRTAGTNTVQAGQAPSGEDIEQAVRSALVNDPTIDADTVRIVIDGGKVTLRGAVPTLAIKRGAATDARAVAGVRRVDNRLKVRPAETFGDMALERRIEDALRRNPYVDRYDIVITVIDGAAYLSGSVSSYLEKARADDVVAEIPGIVAINNYLEVTAANEPYAYDPYLDDPYVYDYDWYDYQPSYTTLTDAEIQDEVEDELWWSPFVDSDDVVVNVDGGIVTLEGMVSSWAEWTAARENAYEGGATWVVNNLSVLGIEPD